MFLFRNLKGTEPSVPGIIIATLLSVGSRHWWAFQEIKGHLLKDALAICSFPMTRPKGPLESAEASVGLSLLEEAEGRSHTDYHLSVWTWTKNNVFCFVF